VRVRHEGGASCVHPALQGTQVHHCRLAPVWLQSRLLVCLLVQNFFPCTTIKVGSGAAACWVWTVVSVLLFSYTWYQYSIWN